MTNEYSNLFMSLPDVKNYADGCSSGRAAGQAYLKDVKAEDQRFSSLQHTFIRAMEVYGSLSKDEQSGLQGHIVGMCSYINDIIKYRSSVNDLVRQIKTDDLSDTITKAENNFYSDQWKEKARLERSERARKAANKRWEKYRETKQINAA